MNFSLYCITDRQISRGGDVFADIQNMCTGGCRIIQLREKNLSTSEYAGLARQALAITRSFGAKLIINDSVVVTKLAGADGVHLGRADGDPQKARAELGDKAIIGISVSSLADAKAALQFSPDYLGAGAVFPTPTKPDAAVIGIDGLRAICEISAVPVVAIGGIHAGNLDDVLSAGPDGVALVSAIVAAKDVSLAAQTFLSRVQKHHEKS